MIHLYLRYLLRNKLFSFVSIFGFSLSLMFVVILGIYVKNELSYDDFQRNADRIYLYSDGQSILSNCTNPPYLKDNNPDIDGYCRVTTMSKDLQTEGLNTGPGTKLLVADANFFSLFSFPLVWGDAGNVLSQPNSMVRQREKEIAVRKVNGASTGSILRLLSSESFFRIVLSFGVACPLAYWAMARWLGGFEYRTTLSWWLFPLAGVIVFALAQAVVLLFSYRAAGTNPIKYLKNE